MYTIILSSNKEGALVCVGEKVEGGTQKELGEGNEQSENIV